MQILLIFRAILHKFTFIETNVRLFQVKFGAEVAFVLLVKQVTKFQHIEHLKPLQYITDQSENCQFGHIF